MTWTNKKKNMWRDFFSSRTATHSRVCVSRFSLSMSSEYWSKPIQRTKQLRCKKTITPMPWLMREHLLLGRVKYANAKHIKILASRRREEEEMENKHTHTRKTYIHWAIGKWSTGKLIDFRSARSASQALKIFFLALSISRSSPIG